MFDYYAAAQKLTPHAEAKASGSAASFAQGSQQ
jgi:hypothetical protein